VARNRADADHSRLAHVPAAAVTASIDARMGESFRWVTVAAPGASTSVALIARPDTGADTGIRFLVPDAATEHAAMRQRGIEVGDLLRWPGVPPKFEFKDPGGNRFEIVEASA
jgi:lactoylglutathione lyase